MSDAESNDDTPVPFTLSHSELAALEYQALEQVYLPFLGMLSSLDASSSFEEDRNKIAMHIHYLLLQVDNAVERASDVLGEDVFEAIADIIGDEDELEEDMASLNGKKFTPN